MATEGNAPVLGFGPAQISFTFVLNAAGKVIDVHDERLGDGKKKHPRAVDAPQAPSDRRGEKIVSGTFWDPTDYSLGVPRPDVIGTPAAIEKLNRKAVEKHAAFKLRHALLITETTDLGCAAFLRFLKQWTPEQLETLPYADEIRGHNVAFRMEGEAGFIHNREAARALLSAELHGRDSRVGMCLVTGETAPIARLHPPIKGISDKLAPLVSFNEAAFESHGKEQGYNAPVSEIAAFAYGTALNALLTSTGADAKGRLVYPNRVMLGGTTVVFWSETPAADALMGAFFAPIPASEASETRALRDVMQKLEAGVPLSRLGLEFDPATKVYVLGLSPNAARLSVRFWVEQSLGAFAANFLQHWEDLRIEPKPDFWPPPLWALLYELAAQRKAENVPQHLEGEFMRAILTGLPYPRSLLTQTILRIRADQDRQDSKTGRTLEKVSDLRVALLKACLARLHRKGLIPEDVPVSLDPISLNAAYRLGRMFSVLERLQQSALGQRNATIRDRFYASASATPALVFPSLLRNARNHSKTIRSRIGSGLAEWFEDHIADIASGLAGAFPKTLGGFKFGSEHPRLIFHFRLPERQSNWRIAHSALHTRASFADGR